jgi:excinuclease ABC subunit C
LNILNEALVNAESYYKSNYLVYLQKEERTTKAFNELKTITKIENLNLIHMFDMSNLYGIGSVGAMIALSNGEFNKNLYRKFIIKNQESKGDLQYFEEVITRQYKRTLKEETNLPNLIICDGGTNQINFTKEALKKIHLDEIIPVIGLVKDNNHKTDSIILQDGETVKLDKKTGFYNFLLNMQEEVHRFAIGFHRKKMINKIKEK